MSSYAEEFLEAIQAAGDDPHAQAAVGVEFAIRARPEEEQSIMGETIDVAAILHWFDESLIGEILDLHEPEAERRVRMLTELPFIEQFSAGDIEAYNVHEATRLGWRKKLFREDPKRFRKLSNEAAASFEDRKAPMDRIEWIYHFLSADPEKGAAACEKLDRKWTLAAQPEDRHALAMALGELEESRLTLGPAQVEVLLCVAENRSVRGESAQLEDTARRVLALAKSESYFPGEARSQCLLGDVLATQGKLNEAQAAFGRFLAISERLTKQEPSNMGWQRGLAVAHSRIGDVLKAQGKLGEAQAAFEKYLAIRERLAKRDPANAGRQKGLGVAYSRIGDILVAQGKLGEARAVFGKYLAISKSLTEQDPNNAGWQRDLAVAHSRVGDVRQAQGKMGEARAAFGKTLAISKQLAERDPSNVGWQPDLVIAHSKVGDVLRAQEKFAEARAEYQSAFEIGKKLKETDSSNADWQRIFGLAHLRLAHVFQAEKNLEKAGIHVKEAFKLFERLMKLDEIPPAWRGEFELAKELAQTIASQQSEN